MIDWTSLIPEVVLDNLTSREKEYLKEIFTRYKGYPNLEQVWRLMDEPWIGLGCDPYKMDERITAYYRHPVWMLNGLFIEQHAESLMHRKRFTQWVVDQNPKRVADFGGGFGGLARFIGEALPDVQVEVVDPYPHPAAISLAKNTPNVRFVPELSGEYDILIATDVFEHVSDPIGLVAQTATHLRLDGQYLIANCFAPVILCHLPQHFHLNISWDVIMSAMGLCPKNAVVYGRSYQRQGLIDLLAAREKAACGHDVYSWISWLPRGKVRVGQILMRMFCR